MNSLSATSAIEAALFVKCEGFLKGVELPEVGWITGIIINLAECAGPDPLANRCQLLLVPALEVFGRLPLLSSYEKYPESLHLVNFPA